MAVDLLILSCLKFLDLGWVNSLLSCWIGRKKDCFLISKIPYIGGFWLLTCWIGLSSTQFLSVALLYKGYVFLLLTCWFEKKSISPTHVGVFPPLTCWIGLSYLKFCLKLPNVGYVILQLTCWIEKISISPTQKFHI